MKRQEKIDFFLQLMNCSQSISYWCFDIQGKLLNTTSLYSDRPVFTRMVFGTEEQFHALCEKGKAGSAPVITLNEVDLAWATVFEKNKGQLAYLHVLGPLYMSDPSISSIEYTLNRQNVPVSFKRWAIETLAGQPVLSATRFWPYVQMLHYTINGEKIGFESFVFNSNKQDKKPVKQSVIPEEETDVINDRHAGVYKAHLELFSKIEQGDPHYVEALNNAIGKATYGTMKFSSPGDKANSYAIKFITLSVQAAIRGGLPPVIAYAVGDQYESRVFTVKSMAEKKHLMDQMFDDFVRRVREIKKRQDISKPIQTCCDYINLHLYDVIELEELGRTIGYTKYYLSRKFKQELGVSIWDYINQKKVEEAKILLADPALTIQDISYKLNYCSRSYFSEVFHGITGLWPSAWRSQELKM